MPLKHLFVGTAMLALLAGCASGPTDQGTGGYEPTGVSYQGTLPCRNCEAIQLTLDLEGEKNDAIEDRNFTLKAEYIDHPNVAGDELYSGDWEVFEYDVDGEFREIYHLTSVEREGEGSLPQSEYMFMILNGGQSLELLDHNTITTFENSSDLRLNKI